MAVEREIRAKIMAKNLADKAFREFRDAQKTAKKLLESSKTPAEKYVQVIQKLKRALSDASISQQQFNRAQEKALSNYSKASGRKPPGSKPAAVAGRLKRGMVESLAKAFALMGAVEGSLKVTGALSDAMADDFAAAAETVKTLPLGIGAMASALDGVLSRLTGTKKLLEEMDKQLADNRAMQTRIRETIRLQGALESRLGKLRESTGVGALSGVEREIEAVRSAARQELAAFDADMKQLAERTGGALRGRQVGQAAEARTLIVQRANQKLGDIQRRETDKANKIAEREANTARDKAKALEDKRLADLDAASQRERALRSSVARQMYTLEGNAMAAEIERLRHHYDERLRLTTSAVERELLVSELAIAMAGARRAHGRATPGSSPIPIRGGVGASLLGGRFGDIGGRSRAASAMAESRRQQHEKAGEKRLAEGVGRDVAAIRRALVSGQQVNGIALATGV